MSAGRSTPGEIRWTSAENAPVGGDQAGGVCADRDHVLRLTRGEGGEPRLGADLLGVEVLEGRRAQGPADQRGGGAGDEVGAERRLGTEAAGLAERRPR